VLPIVLDLAAYRRPALAGHAGPLRRRPHQHPVRGRIIPNKRIDDLIRVFAVYQRHVDP
jgi:hypothetical protein